MRSIFPVNGILVPAHECGQSKRQWPRAGDSLEPRAQYRRLVTRRGKNKAVVAVAHSVLVIAYHLLARETTYQDLGSNSFDERDRQRVIRRSVRRLEALGCQVIVNPLRAAA